MSCTIKTSKQHIHRGQASAISNCKLDLQLASLSSHSYQQLLSTANRKNNDVVAQLTSRLDDIKDAKWLRTTRLGQNTGAQQLACMGSKSLMARDCHYGHLESCSSTLGSPSRLTGHCWQPSQPGLHGWEHWLHLPVQPSSSHCFLLALTKLGLLNPGTSQCSIVNCCRIKHANRALRTQAQLLMMQTKTDMLPPDSPSIKSS